MNMFVTILGSGAALPTGARRCSAQMLNVNGQKVLIDCAEGTQDRIRQHHLKLQSIGHIVISHLHGDHFFGLPGLLSTMHLCGRTEPITIVAPKGARQVVETTFELTGNHIGFEIDWQEMDFDEGCRRVLETKRVVVDAFPIVHSVPTYGFRFTEVPRGGQGPIGGPQAVEAVKPPSRPAVRPRTYAYCCDTAYTEALLPYVQGADVLCLECTFANELEQLAAERLHLTAGQAGRLAAQAGVGRLLLTHISARYREPEILMQQASAEFADCTIAEDGMRVEIKV